MRFKSHDMSMRQHLVAHKQIAVFSCLRCSMESKLLKWVGPITGCTEVHTQMSSSRCINQLEGTCSWHLPVAQSFRWEGHWMASHLYGWQGGGSHSEDNPMLLRHLVLLCIVSSMPTPACHHLLVHEAKKTHAVFTKEYSGNSHYKYSSNTWQVYMK